MGYIGSILFPGHHTGAQDNTTQKNADTPHSLSGLRNHDPSFQAAEDSTCLRPQTSQSSCFSPKNILLNWNIHPDPLIWLRMTSDCCRKIVVLAETKIQDIEDIQKHKTTTLNTIPQQEFKKMFRTMADSIVGLSAYLLKGSTSRVTPLRKL